MHYEEIIIVSILSTRKGNQQFQYKSYHMEHSAYAACQHVTIISLFGGDLGIGNFTEAEHFVQSTFIQFLTNLHPTL